MRARPADALLLDGHPCRHATTDTWYNEPGRPDPIVTPAFDTDSKPASFSEAEQRDIIAIWRAVAEDFAPFDVDVRLRVGVWQAHWRGVQPALGCQQ